MWFKRLHGRSKAVSLLQLFFVRASVIDFVAFVLE